MAVDGYLNFDTKINTDGFDKGTDAIGRKAEKTAEKVVESADKAAEAAADAAEEATEAITDTLHDTEEQAASTVNKSTSLLSKALGKLRTLFTDADKAEEQNAEKAEKHTKTLHHNVEAVNHGLSTMKSTLSGIASMMGLALGVREMIESAAAVNAANSQLEQTFGELQDAAVAAMKRVADASGILETRLQGVGTSIYAFAKTSGMESTQALTMMEEALQAAADSAAYYDRSLEDTSETLKSFLKGNYANDAALGLSATETTRNAAAMKRYGKAFQQLSEAQKQLTLLQMVKDANALSGAAGQAARESEGWENVLGNLKEAWRQLLAVVGQPVLHGAVTVVKSMTAALEVLTLRVQTAVGALSQLFGWETDNSAAVAANISESVEGQDALTDAVEETAKAQETMLAGFDKITKLGSAEQNSSTAGSPVTAVTAPVSVPVTVESTKTEAQVDRLTKKLRALTQPIRLAWDANIPALTESMKTALDKVRGMFVGIGDSLAQVWTNGTGERALSAILQIFGNIFDTIGSIAERFRIAWEGGTGTRIVQNIADAFQNVLDMTERCTDATAKWAAALDFAPLLGSVEMLTGALEPLTKTVGEGLEQLWTEVLLPLGKWTLEQAVPEVLEVFAHAIDIVNGAARRLKPLGKWLWEKFLQPASGFAGDALIGFLQDLGDLLGSISDLLDGSTSLSGFVAKLKELEPLTVAVAAIVTGGGIARGFKNIAAAAAKLSGVIVGFVTVKWPVIFSTVMKGITTVIQWVSTHIPAAVGKAFALIGAFIAGWEIGTLIRKYWGDVIDEVLWDVFDNWVSGFGVIKDAWNELWRNLGEEFRTFVLTLIRVFEGGGAYLHDLICEDIPAFFKSGWEAVRSALAGVPAWFRETFSTAAGNVKGVFRSIGTWFGGRWNNIKSAFSGAGEWFRQTFQTAHSYVTGIFGSIGGWFSERYTDVQSAFGTAGDWFRETFSDAWENIRDIFRTEKVSTFFGSVLSSIYSPFAKVASWFRDKFSAAWQAVRDVFSRGGDVFTGIQDGISSVFKDVVNSLIDGLNSVVSKPFEEINGFLWVLRNWDFFGTGAYPFAWVPEISIPEIPRLAQGTVVPANYGEFLAVLGDNTREAEVVSPVSKIEEAVEHVMKRYPQGGGDIHIQLDLDGKKVYKTVIRRNNESIRMTGRNPLNPKGVTT